MEDHMTLEHAKEYYWKFTLDKEGKIKEPVSPIEADKFHKIRCYFNDDSCKMIVHSNHPIHWIFKKEDETVYCFRRRDEAEEFVKTI